MRLQEAQIVLQIMSGCGPHLHVDLYTNFVWSRPWCFKTEPKIWFATKKAKAQICSVFYKESECFFCNTFAAVKRRIPSWCLWRSACRQDSGDRLLAGPFGHKRCSTRGGRNGWTRTAASSTSTPHKAPLQEHPPSSPPLPRPSASVAFSLHSLAVAPPTGDAASTSASSLWPTTPFLVTVRIAACSRICNTKNIQWNEGSALWMLDATGSDDGMLTKSHFRIKKSTCELGV